MFAKGKGDMISVKSWIVWRTNVQSCSRVWGVIINYTTKHRRFFSLGRQMVFLFMRLGHTVECRRTHSQKQSNINSFSKISNHSVPPARDRFCAIRTDARTKKGQNRTFHATHSIDIISKIVIAIIDKAMFISRYILLNNGCWARCWCSSPALALQCGNSSSGTGRFRNSHKGFQPSSTFIMRSRSLGASWINI